MGYQIGLARICCFEVFMFYSFFRSEYGIYLQNRKAVYGTLMLLVALIITVNHIDAAILNLFAVPSLYFLAGMLLFRPTVNNCIAYTITYYIILVGGEAAFELLYRLIGAETGIVINVMAPEYFWLLVLERLAGYLFFRLIIHYKRHIGSGKEAVFRWYLAIIPVTTFVVLSAFLYMDFPESFVVRLLVCLGAFLLYFTDALEFILLEKLSYAFSRANEMETAVVRNEMERKYQERLGEENQKYARLVHDLSAYLRTMRELKNQSASTEIDNLYGCLNRAAEEIGKNLYSTNKILNSILCERVEAAQKLGIGITVSVEPNLYVNFIEDYDMIAMFSNLLDNAVEAAGRCSGKRLIRVHLFAGSDYYLFMKIENTYENTINKRGGTFLTSKANKGRHGIGIENVKRSMQKYHGSLEFVESDGIFTMNLALSMEPKKKNY